MKKILMLLMLGISGCAIAQTPISALPVAATSTTGVEVLPVVQAAATRKMSLAQIQSWLEGSDNIWVGLNTFSSNVPRNILVLLNNSSNGAGLKNWSLRVGSTGAFTIDPITDGGIIAGTNPLLAANKNSSNALTSIQLGNLTDLPSIDLEGPTTVSGSLSASGPVSTSSSVTVGSPTGGSCGSGCLNAQTIEIQGATVTVPPVFAYGVIDGVGSCSLSPNVATANITSCTRNSTGNYTVILADVWTVVPACTVTAGGGSEGGTNADSVQEATTSLSGMYRISILAFTAAISPQDNNFQITCIGR